ncbi:MULTISPECIES: ornithine cyclodeaminase [Rhodomicrobium]|uniref:ornithine cyclodeaminase family protein n=1 Tax=Rhodomicrobium TaxID=1068 RepID=UPI001FD8D928|nr:MULTISPECIES: ornithine cyclodeaminase [Rhodomicrobium]
MLHIDAHQVNALLDWPSLIAAMREAHSTGPRPQIGDMMLGPAGRTLLVRGAFFEGVGIGLKAVTVFEANAARAVPKPTVQGEFLLFGEEDGSQLCSIDGAAITPWKTAADSALGASLLAPPAPRVMTMVGAGTMARPLIEAHLSARPSIEEIRLWNRTQANAELLAATLDGLGPRIRVTGDLAEAVAAADLISAATLSVAPLIRGEWLKPGAHLDLVGAFRPDMREADDAALLRARIFVDARETTMPHIGEIRIPLEAGTITPASIEADLFDLCRGFAVNRAPADITLYKNGGGAHLDLIVARHIFARATAGP